MANYNKTGQDTNKEAVVKKDITKAPEAVKKGAAPSQVTKKVEVTSVKKSHPSEMAGEDKAHQAVNKSATTK